MFLDVACVLNRHQPAGERHHLCAAFDMLVVKRRLFLDVFGHAISVNVNQTVVKKRRRGWQAQLLPLPCAEMKWLDKLERRFGFLGIPGLPRILVGFAALVFGLAWLLPGFTSMLTLDPVRIRHGEVWRLITYIFIPQTQSPLWVIFALWFLWWIGEGVERAWGSFRLTLYFLFGMTRHEFAV